jgi:hypothetical protein
MWEYFLNKIVTPKVKAGGKNVTNGGMGVSAVSTYYNMGRALAISGKTFDLNPTPVDGDSDSRSLKEVVTEIKDRFFTNCKVELNTAAPKADSGVTVANGTVSGLPAGITAGEASKLFATTEGGKVVFCKGKKPVEDTVAVTSDLIVHIMEDDGSILELGWKIG